MWQGDSSGAGDRNSRPHTGTDRYAFYREKMRRCLWPVVIVLFFSGCVSRPVDRSPALLSGAMQSDSAYCLERMAQERGSAKTTWQLLAVRALLSEGKTREAGVLFSHLPVQLDRARHQEQSLLAVELKLAEGDFSMARMLLAKITLTDLKGTQRGRYWLSTITAQQGRPSPALLRALIAQTPLLSGEKDPQINSDAVWTVLTSMTAEQADAVRPGTDEPVLQGWLALRRVWADNRDVPQGMKAAVKAWLVHWPHHPAAKTRPLPLVNAMNAGPVTVSKIALLLPLSGQAARYGRAVLQGVEAEAKVNRFSTDRMPELSVYDSAGLPVTQLLAQAQKEGAMMVVGPLLKKHVVGLTGSNVSLNVLALNLPAHPVARDNLCYFALSPEDEARSAARHIRGQGKHFPLLLLPHGELGERVADAFTAEWQGLGGRTVQVQRFGSVAGLKAGINRGTGLRLTGTRAGGIDAVYIIATPSEMTYLRAMIVMRNGSRAGAMLYASSRSISGHTGDDYRLEMEGLQFSDITLMSGKNPQMKQRALDAANNDYVLARLYAMGADAWRLANLFSQMHQNTGFKLNGNTGELSIAPGCVVRRALPWFRYVQGRVVPVS